MSFLTDLFGGGTIEGQTTVRSPQEQIARGGAVLPEVARQTTAYERALAEPRSLLFQDIQAQLNPFARQSQLAAQEQILESLTAPYAVDPYDVQLALQTSGLTGFGASEAGRYRGAEMFERGLRDRRERAQERALTLGQITPGLDYALTRESPFGREPGILGLQMGREEDAVKDLIANQAKQRQIDEDFADTRLLIEAGGTILGGVVGYYTGDVAGGAMAGRQIGSQLVPGQRVQGAGQQSAIGGPKYGTDPNSGQNRNQWTSILSGIGGMFGGSGGMGRYSGGQGQLYGDEQGNVRTSTRAQGVSLPGWTSDAGTYYRS